MLFSSWLRNWKRSASAARRVARKQRLLPRLEVLEDRTVPSGYQQLNLVGYTSGLAHHTDPNLNGWGMTSMPNGSFVVSNAFTTGLATFYDTSGHVLPQTITVPGSAAGSAALGLGPGGHPTGVVYNSSSDFVISENGKSAPARLIFDSIDGTISGWNPAIDPSHAILMHDTFAEGNPAVFTGLELAQNSKGQNILYAADFLNDRVDMFNGNFKLIGSFTDPSVKSVDSNLSAWSVQAVGNELYVTFADLKNFSGGAVDVFDTDGNLLRHVAANAPGAGPLNNPWGIIQAPKNFGAYSNDILIGNVAGAGNINVFDPKTGAYLGQLDQPDGAPIAIKGLWDLEFGDGKPHGGKTSQLFFDAGPNKPGDATGGLFGVIHAAGHQGGHGHHAKTAASQFVISAPPKTDASVVFSLTVTIENPYGNVVNMPTAAASSGPFASLDTPSELDQTESVSSQTALDQVAKFTDTLSNVLKKIDDTGSTITGNLK